MLRRHTHLYATVLGIRFGSGILRKLKAPPRAHYDHVVAVVDKFFLFNESLLHRVRKAIVTSLERPQPC